MKIFFGIILCVPLLLFGGTRIVKNVSFDRNVEGHMKRAADANTAELARQEMAVVVKYLEDKGLVTGYTSVIYTTPDEDVEFWYQNLKSSLEELYRININTPQLEKSNVLMKLRETLLDSGEKSVEVTVPPGISVYPHNTAYLLWGMLSLVLAIIGIVLIIAWTEE